jgi:hypothetical protein
MKKTFSIALAWLLLLSLSLSACAAPGTAPELPYIGISSTNGEAGDDSTIPPEVVQPPSITVFTEFPSGTVTDPTIDITYEAIPSTGAIVTGVYYTLNDGFPNYLYVAGDEGRGELGQGRMNLGPDENTIVFVVEDSSGQTAQFEVAEHPVFDVMSAVGGPLPEYDSDKQMPSETEGMYYVSDRISIMANEETSYAEVEQAVTDINGIIIWNSPMINLFIIQVPEGTEQELQELCETLQAKYPTLFLQVYLYTGHKGTWSVTFTDDPS